MRKPKKSAGTTGRKTVTASARSKNVGIKQSSKGVDLNGSFITASGRTTVSTVHYTP